MDRAATERDPRVKESLFNALASASAAPGARALDWGPIVSALGDLDLNCLEHALVALGFLREPGYRALFDSYRSHPSERIRSAACDALALLESGPAATARGKGKAV
jgi:hypothetical protein